MAKGGGVNQWIACFGVLTQVACHVGRPSMPISGVEVGRIVAPAAEPGLADSLRSGLSAALAAKGVHGADGSERVEVVVQTATTRPTAVGSQQQIHTAHLVIMVRVFGSTPREALLSDERSYPLDARDSLATASARASAFDDLARSLTQDAASWIVYGPRPQPKE